MTPPCPICGRSTDAAPARVRPFCSPRCADIDLGRWFTGAYAIPTTPDLEDDASPPPHDQA